MTALSPVGETARAGDPWRFRAALFAPEAARERLFALIAFNVELSRIGPGVSEPLLGEIRLTWWLEGLDDLHDRGVARGHEVLEALAEAPPGRARLTALAEARRFDIHREPFADAAALDRYLEDTGGALAALQAEALGASAADQAAAAEAGYAEAAGRFIRALPLLGEGLPPGDDAGALAARARGRLAEARRALRGRFLPPLLSVRPAERALVAAMRPGFSPHPEAGAVSPFREQMALLFRAAARRF